MKHFLQNEAAECGLACVAMVANHFDNRYDLSLLRRTQASSIRGSSLRQVISAAAKIGLKARPLRVELNHLDKLRLPAIIHWDMNHFVVLSQATKSHITIVDPAVGPRRISLKEGSDHFTGIALELEPEATFTRPQQTAAVKLRDLTGPMIGLRRSLAQILSLSLALQLFVLLAPFFMQWIVDQVLVSSDTGLLTLLAVSFLTLVILQSVTSWLRGWSVIHLSSSFSNQWSGNVFSHMLKLPLDYFTKRHLGDVTSRMGSLQSIQRTLTTSFVEAIIDGLMGLATLALMLLYSWKLACITVLTVGVYLAVRAAAFSKIRQGTEAQLISSAVQQSHLIESIRGLQSLKVAGRESERRSTHLNLINDTVNRDAWLALLNLGFGTTSQLLFGFERIVVIWFAALLALDNIFSIGMLVAYLAYKEQFTGRAAGLIDKWTEFRMLQLHGERLADVVLTPAEDHGESASELPAACRSSLRVNNVSYRYSDSDPWVIKDCTFEVKEGECVAIVGPSGSGKTTLMKLMLGLINPTQGSIEVGGNDLRSVTPASYRERIAAVMQDDQLFAGSIAENIALGEDVFSQVDVEVAAMQAAIHDEVMAMQMRYHSLIGDMGSSLSGGQKQRVILARALYRKPKILFLDEATSHLDAASETSVNASIRKLLLTRVVIAHRQETIRSADRVLVLANGGISQKHGGTKMVDHHAAVVTA